MTLASLLAANPNVSSHSVEHQVTLNGINTQYVHV